MPNAEEPISFGSLLRQYRIAAGLTQETLAERTGLGVRSIQHLEGGSHVPHRGTVERLVGGLRLTGEDRRHFERVAQPTPRQREAVSVPPGEVLGDDGLHRAPGNNLPAHLTTFIGRSQDMLDVKVLLTANRLLTLTGTGGCGKTRLAIQVAVTLVGDFPDGIWLVELAPVTDPSLVASTIATVVSVQEQPHQPLLDTLVDALRSKRLLLILDNCEHLIAVCAQLADVLLRGCPSLQILATSREALSIPGEVPWRVPSLPIPPQGWLPTQASDFGALTRYDGVRLFVERARVVDPGFVVTEQNAPVVAQICRRLDGIPLAIELAATRVKMLAVERIAARLDDQFRLLTGGSRTALPRQQTLRATIDWSYNLLGEPERRLFRRLAVFVGGWSLEAAEAVCAGAGIDEREVLDLLTQLVDKSLVQVEKEGAEERYRLLETIRQYGSDRLVEAGDAETFRDRHRDWFLRLAERAKPELIGPRQVAWFDRPQTDLTNFRTALAWCLEAGSADLGLRLAGALWRLWHVRNVGEGRDWLSRVLEAPSANAPTVARADVLGGASMLARHDGYMLIARSMAEESLAIYRTVGDAWWIAEASRQLAVQAFSEGDYARADGLVAEALARAREAGASWVSAQALGTLAYSAEIRGDYQIACHLLEESLTMLRDLGDRRSVAEMLSHLGWLVGVQGDPATGRAYLQEGLTIARELRSNVWIAFILGCLGSLARIEGDYGQSRALLAESVALARETGNRELTGEVFFHLGSLARAEGDVGKAEAQYRESMFVFRDLDERAYVAVAICFCGVMANARGAYQRGARLLGAVDHKAARQWWLGPDDRRAYEDSLVAAQAALGEGNFAATWAEGQAMTLEQAVACALSDDRAAAPA